MKREGQRIILVAAMDEAGGIGKNNSIPWMGKYPEDMRHFKEVTTRFRKSSGRPTVIMGRKTWESLPGKMRPLKDRFNIVLSRSTVAGMDCPANLRFASTIEQTLAVATDDVYVIGGADIYWQFAPLADQIILTVIPGTYECDTKFPDILIPEAWGIMQRKVLAPSNIVACTYERQKDDGGWVPEPEVHLSRKDQGLGQKFKVERLDGQSAPGGRHENCRYFVLDLDHDPFAPLAMLVYGLSVNAAAPSGAGDQKLAKDIFAMWPDEKVPMKVVEWVNEVMSTLRYKARAEIDYADFMQRFNLKEKK